MRLELIFPLLLLQPRIKSRKTLIPTRVEVSAQFEHSFTNLLGDIPTTEAGIDLRQWVNHQGIENFLDLLSWDEDELKAIPAQQIFSLDDKGQGSHLRTNHVNQICGLITYVKHVYRVYMDGDVRPDPYHLKNGVNKLQP